jgi:thiol:disulfide interchange protein
MKTFLLTLFTFSLSFLNFAQDHIQWSGKYDQASQKAVLTAKLDEGWHVYSQMTDESVGPVATKFELKKNEFLKIESEIHEPKSIDAYDPNFEGNVRYFEKQVSFEQKISALETTGATYKVTYMVCNEEMCLPPVDKIITLTIIK